MKLKSTSETAVIKVLNNMGFKYDFELEQLDNNTYKFISKQGKIKIFKVFKEANKYFKWNEENNSQEKRMYKSWTCYVVELK